MTYTVKIPIGDWSNDGHGKCDYFYITSNKSASEIDAITARVHGVLGFRIGDICDEYEVMELDGEIIEHLTEAGFVLTKQHVEDPATDDLFMTSEHVLHLWMDILKFIDPTFEYSMFDRDAGVQLVDHRDIPGYGVFGS